MIPKVSIKFLSDLIMISITHFNKLENFSIFIAIFVYCNGCSPRVPTWLGTKIEPSIKPKDFLLHDHYGKPFQLSKQSGKVVILFFGFSRCPDICPATLNILNTSYQELGPAVDQARFIFITLDQHFDTTEVLQHYFMTYNDHITGLTGSENDLHTIYREFGIFSETENSIDNIPSINHTSSVLLIDKQGNWRLSHSPGMTAKELTHDILQLIHEKIK